MAGHLSAERVQRYAGRVMSPEELLAADDHLATCEACRLQIAAAREPEEALAFLRRDLESAAAAPEHLPYELLAGYVDETLDPVDREIAQSHLELCARCSAEAADLRAFRAEMTTYPATEHSPVARPTTADRLRAWWHSALLWAPLSAAAAAALTVGIVFTRVVQPQRDQVASLREAQSTATRSLAQLQRDLKEGQTKLAQGQQANQRLRQANQKLHHENTKLRQRVHGATVASANPTAPKSSAAPAREIQLARSSGDELNTLKDYHIAPPAGLAGLQTAAEATRSGPGEGPMLTPLAPVGTVVPTDRPTFSWQPLEGASRYEIQLFDISAGEDNARPLPGLSSKGLATTKWTPSHPLPRNRRLAWELTARNGGQELAQTPPLKFQVLSLAKSKELEQARAKSEAQQLRLGIAEAQAGLLDEAEQRFQQVLKEDPDSIAARKLLIQVRAQRHPRE